MAFAFARLPVKRGTMPAANALAPRWNARLAAVHERERARSNGNQATLAAARKLAAYLLAVDKAQRPFEDRKAEA